MRRCPTVWAWIGVCALAGAVEVSLVNESMELVFDTAAGGGLSGLRSIPGNVPFLSALGSAEADRSPWLLVLRTAAGASTEVTARHAARLTHKLSGRSLELIWEGVQPDGVLGELRVAVRVTLVPTEGKSRWEISVDGTAAAALWDVQFPRILGLKGLPFDHLALPHYLGRLIHDPVGCGTRIALEYPQPASMQWLAYWGTAAPPDPTAASPRDGTPVESGWRPDEQDATGVYLAAEDGDGWHKRFAVDSSLIPGRLSWWIHHLPSLDQWPLRPERHPVNYALPYPVVLTCFRGDYHEAAGIYRDWARRKPWCRRGPADTWPAQAPLPGTPDECLWVPTWFRQTGFWAKFYQEPAKVVPEWAAYRRWLRVPMASHYYRYTIAKFDDDYPEPLPADPYLIPGMLAAREIGVRPLPYTNGVIWDTDTQSWQRENGLAAAIKDGAGRFIPWDIHGEIFAYMCPVEQWRSKLRDTTAKLVGEHAMAGVYLDCLAATRAMPCYDLLHQHGVHGGDYRAKGNRRLLEELRLGTRRLVPDAAFFTEEIGEQYIDLMDGFLTLDLTRSSLQAGEQVFPLFSVVYHPYTLNFGSDAQLDMDPDAFALQMGTLFCWGSVPLVSAQVAVPPQAGDRNSEFLREVVQAYYCVGLPFLQDGQWERMTVVPDSGSRPRGRISLATAAHTVTYRGLNRAARTWQGPAVLASAWRNGAAVGVALANITGAPQNVLLAMDPGGIGVPAESRLTALWPEGLAVAADGTGSFPLSLGPGRVAILVLGDPGRSWRRLPLEECPWDLLTADHGVLPERVEREGFLWACSDGLVSQQFRDGGCSVVPMVVGEQGAVVRRAGRQAERRGAAAEGQGLPRRRLDQPFALLRRLPHQVTQGEPRVTVLGGEADWLLCRVSGACEIAFPKPGLTFVHGGSAVPSPTELATRSRVGVPGDPAGYLVAYWVVDRGPGRTVAERAQACNAAILEAELVREALDSLYDAPTLAALASLSRTVAAALEASRAAPALAAPGAPLVGLMQRTSAIVAAVTGMDATLVAEDDWLTPGLPKTVTLATRGREAPPEVRIVALADARAGEVHVAPSPADVGSSLVRADVLLRREEYVERLVPIAGFVRCPVAGESMVLSALLWLDSNRPLCLQPPRQAPITLAGRETQTAVTLRNVSPLDLSVAVIPAGPPGWTVVAEPAATQLAALSEQTVRLRLTPPAGATTQSAVVQVRATYAPEQVSGVTVGIPCAVRERLDVLRQPQPRAAERSTARLRHRNQVAIWGQAGDRIPVTFRNVRVTRYEDTLRVVIYDPGFRQAESRDVRVDQSATVTLSAAEAGVFHAMVDSGSGSAEVDTGGRPSAEVATAECPLSLFCSPIRRWFYVPKAAQRLFVAARDGGPDETARIRITEPGGRVAFDRDGTWGGEHHEMPVKPGAAGRVWMLECWPVQDISLWLGGDACPYLSSDLAEVPAPVVDLAHP